MKLQPFAHVNDISFSISPGQLIEQLGLPQRRERNAVGLNEMDYGHTVYRFQDCGRLEEITRRAPVLHLGQIAVPFRSLAGFVRTQDPHTFERGGFLVSPRFGLAFAPASPDWVTALARHCIATWRALR